MHHVVKTYWGVEVYFHIFLPSALYPLGKSPRNTLDRKLGGLKCRSGRGGEEKTSHHCLCRELNPVRPTRELMSIFR